jgi:pyruvate/2-oxoglutarate dehydrogenase complex dihydrolipoamide acyltransferase (E2) component
MARALHIPRVNNNDDTVRVARIAVAVGDAVRAGELVLEVETDKAVIAVEAEADGHVLALPVAVGETVGVGAVAAWFGATVDEAVPESAAVAAGPGPAEDVTAKARLLLRRHRLAADRIPRTGPRLTAADVEQHLAAHPRVAALEVPADSADLTPIERATLATVSWQREHAAATYLEVDYDPRPWDAHAAGFASAGRLLFSPLLALMAHRLACIATGLGANGTITDDGAPRRIRYRQVNLGFTVQAGETLYLCVVAAADGMDAAGFVARLSDLQRRALGHKLDPAEMRGATIGFTSMARWGVRRHIPVLAPHTALMVSHCAKSPDGTTAVLGAAYDHRVLSGFDAARLLRKLASA